MEKLTRVAGRTNDALIKLAIAEVMRLAEDAPAARPASVASTTNPGGVRKVYRGCVVG